MENSLFWSNNQVQYINCVLKNLNIILSFFTLILALVKNFDSINFCAWISDWRVSCHPSSVTEELLASIVRDWRVSCHPSSVTEELVAIHHPWLKSYWHPSSVTEELIAIHHPWLKSYWHPSSPYWKSVLYPIKDQIIVASDHHLIIVPCAYLIIVACVIYITINM